MFWGLILKGNRKYSQKIAKAFHLSHAALDIDTCLDDGPVKVLLTSDQTTYVLCTLRKNSVEQFALDLNFFEGTEISFASQGSGNVHLSGYLVQDDFDELGEEEEDETEVVTKSKKNKKQTAMVVENEEDDDDDEDDEDFKLDGEPNDDDDDEDDSNLEEAADEQDDSDDSEDSDSDEEEVQEPKKKQQKLEQPKQNGVENKQKLKQKDKKEQQPHTPKPVGEKTLSGGVKISDQRIGQGPEAKPGKKVTVYYEGRLKSNNKVFDSTLKGTGFAFKLGIGEVIKGWDVGVAGMKVGGKRKIICPPHMAYGAKGSPPIIPPNSVLIFDVELKGVQDKK